MSRTTCVHVCVVYYSLAKQLCNFAVFLRRCYRCAIQSKLLSGGYLLFFTHGHFTTHTRSSVHSSLCWASQLQKGQNKTKTATGQSRKSALL
eukprot:6488086-Amphidinium_carterae.1